MLEINPAEEMALIRMEIAELKNKKNSILSGKKTIESELAQLLGKIRSSKTHLHRLSNDEYRKLCNKQSTLKRKLSEIESQATPISNEIRSLCAKEDLLRSQYGESVGGITANKDSSFNEMKISLCRIRDYWQGFAADQTRVNSMRLMAAQFAEELTVVLSGKPYFTKN